MVLNYPMLRLVTVTSKLDWHSLQLLCNELVKLIFRKRHYEQGEIHKNSNGLAPMASLPSLCICYTRCVNQGSVSSEFNGCRSRTRVATVQVSKFIQALNPELLSKHPFQAERLFYWKYLWCFSVTETWTQAVLQHQHQHRQCSFSCLYTAQTWIIEIEKTQRIDRQNALANFPVLEPPKWTTLQTWKILTLCINQGSVRLSLLWIQRLPVSNQGLHSTGVEIQSGSGPRAHVQAPVFTTWSCTKNQVSSKQLSKKFDRTLQRPHDRGGQSGLNPRL